MFKWILLLIGLGTAVFAQTSLWKVTYQGKTLYLGGAIHIMREADYPLPAPYERAFAAADALVCETDLEAMRSPLGAAEMQQHLMFGPGKTLRDVLQRETYTKVRAYAEEHRIPVELFDRMKPQLVAVSVMGLELEKMGMAAPGADTHYFDEAKRKGMTIRWFESVSEQVRILETMGRDDEDGMVRQSLDELPQYPMVMTALLNAWRTGDVDTLERLGREYLMHESPADYRRLVVDRNKKWMPLLQKIIQSPETEFVLVGVLHLVGPDGLVSQLKRKGYRVEQL